MINYVELIAANYPTVQCYTRDDPSVYESIVWSSGDPIPLKADLDAAYVTDTQVSQTALLSYQCQQDIIGGFVSNALGTDHLYDSQNVDQINLIGATLTIAPNHDAGIESGSMYYAARDVSTNVKTYELHTYGQLRQVMNDGSVFKLSKLQLFAEKREAVAQCTDVDSILAITWPDPV